MLSLGAGELIVVGVVALLVIGPERLPKITRDVGRLYGQLRRAADDLRTTFVLEADRQDEDERIEELRLAQNAVPTDQGEDGGPVAQPSKVSLGNLDSSDGHGEVEPPVAGEGDVGELEEKISTLNPGSDQ
jgi:sec-independent protein translocase protein TatB